MREIKFRAWDGSKMYTFDNHAFDLIYNDISGWNVAPNIPCEQLRGMKWTTGESSDSAKDFQLMQFTGLKDKNGKEIYEDDIIQFKSYWVNKRWWSNVEDIPIIEEECKKQREDFYICKERVRFDDGCFVIGSLTFKSVARGYMHKFGESYSCDTEEKQWDFEVIGNIYENPELLTP